MKVYLINGHTRSHDLVNIGPAAHHTKEHDCEANLHDRTGSSHRFDVSCVGPNSGVLRALGHRSSH